MKSWKFLAAMLLLIVPAGVYAQSTVTLTGKIVDKSSGLPLEGANIVVRSSGEKVLTAGISDEKGVFVIKNLVIGQTVNVTVTYVGYFPVEKSLTPENSHPDFGTLGMVEKPAELKEVSVEGRIPPAVQKGDTVEYNADAYKTNPDADAEDLAKKMPGVEIDNGTVKAQGEQVNKVTVDGRPFFDQDPTLALRSLPASVVEKIQVFDEQSEQSKFTGFDDGETTKTMNIVTRANMRNGSFGKLYAAYGSDNRYLAGGNVNLFHGSRRISLIGMANNVNQQNFSNEDLLGMMSGGGRRGSGFRGGRGGGRGFRGGGMPSGGMSDRNNFMVGQQPGISETGALGLNYSDQWGKKISVTGSYFVNRVKNTSHQQVTQDYFTTGNTNPLYNENNYSSSKNLNHRLNFRITYDIDSANRIMLIPRFSFQSNSPYSEISSQSLDGTQLLNQTNNILHSDYKGYNLSNMLLYTHRFRKRGRTFSVSLNGTLNDRSGDGNQYSESIFYIDTASNEVLNQYSKNVTNGKMLGTRLAWTEPLGERSILMFSVSGSLSENKADKQTFNFNDALSEYTLRDTSLSSVYNSNYQTAGGGLNYRYRKDRFSLMAGLSYQSAGLSSDEEFPQQDNINHNFNSLLPQMMLRYNIDRSRNLRLFYRTSTNPPSISQLQNVIDNSNPVQLSSGNPYLKQTYQHNVFLRYSAVNTTRASSFFVLLGGGIGSNYVVNSTFLAQNDTILPGGIHLQPGTQFVRPVNADGYRNMRLFSSYGIPLKWIKTNLNLNAGWNYTRTPGLINGVASFTDNNVLNAGIVLASNISENVDFTISSASNYAVAKNSVREEMNNTYFFQRSEIGLNLIIWKGITFSSQLQHQYYTGLSASYNQSYVLWNAGIGKKVFKNHLGEFKLSAFDLLNQNRSISRNVTELYIEDSKTQVLRQYVLLSFTYNLRQFNIPENTTPHRDRPPGPYMR